MKMKLIGILFTVVSVISTASAMAVEITAKEKRAACQAIIDTLDYDEGSNVSLCMRGEWIISDVEEGRGNRQVAFNWAGKASSFERSIDKCSGYVLTQTISYRKKTMSVIDLECQ